MIVSTVIITRELTDEGADVVAVETHDTNNEPLPLVESLGMLRMAEDSVIRYAMGEIPDDED